MRDARRSHERMRSFPGRRPLAEETDQNTWLDNRRRWIQRARRLYPFLDDLSLADLEEDNVSISQALLDFFKSVDPSRASSLEREIPSPNTRARHELELEEAGQND